MARLLALTVLVLAPRLVAPLAADDEPAWATAPTTGAADPTTAGTTDAATAAATDSDTGDVTGATTETMPPVYEPCGCHSAGEAGGWAVLALLFTAGSPCRRRRPTS